MYGLERSAMVSYSKGSWKYVGEMRATLERLVDKSVVVTDESCGRTRYSVNVATVDWFLIGEVVAP